MLQKAQRKRTKANQNLELALCFCKYKYEVQLLMKNMNNDNLATERNCSIVQTRPCLDESSLAILETYLRQSS